MENNFKLRISKLFQSSFNSCRTEKNISDVASSDQPFFFPENRHHRQLIDLFSPKPQPIAHSLSKPKPHLPKTKKSNEKAHFPVTGKPHSVSPVFDPPLFYQKKPKQSKKKKPHYRKTLKNHDFTSITDNYYYDCCSSDEDYEMDDETTLFSSRSFSSDSSASFYQKRAPRKKKRSVSSGCKDKKATDVIPIKGKCKLVKDSIAIVKKSSDPHEDFRVSMLEMIVERQIFGSQDLENLLQCFLSLNSEDHHGVIYEVFTEIWDTLFF
uniref:transcription repressor OFP8-like n=1 Tax=Erigeron canadensis TaxID=72917 RepID=UPI001CB89B05|nr:transcription repressor OFP8-like [Erigeron canadensis]